MDDDSEYERLAYSQRLKAAIHHTVGRICDEHRAEEGIHFNRQFIATVSEATYKYSQSLTQDLTLFARHAKRTQISPEDVKLAVRKSPALLLHLQQLQDDMENEAQEKKATKKKKARSTAKARASTTADDD